MSYQIGMDTILLKPTPRLAHMEFCDNPAVFKEVANGDWRKFNEAWEIDLLWSVNDGPVPWSQRGRTTDMGHGEYVVDGSDRRSAKRSPFQSAEDVWAFDAVAEYGLPDFGELVRYYEQSYQHSQRSNPDQVVTGGYYKTLVSGAIESFGWDALLEAGTDQDRFERVLDSFFRLSLHHFRAWAQTSAPVFVCHDDMVWSAGPFMSPAFYRRAIFPRYRQLWQVLRDAGKKVLYCADAQWGMFVRDIAEAGADGFIFEPMMELDPIVKEFGRTHVIVASKVDCRTLTFGTKEQIQAEIDGTLALALDCPGFFFCVGNHIPSNVPVGNALFYGDYLRQHWLRH